MADKYKRLDFEDMKRAEAMIREHADVAPDTSGGHIVRYHRLWSDSRIAKELARELDWPNLQANVIERFRRKHIGALIGGRTAASEINNPILRTAIQARTVAMACEQRLAEVEEMMRAIYAKLGLEVPAGFGDVQTPPTPFALDVTATDDEAADTDTEPLRVRRS